ncbi:MAG: family 10 glycosylhydrolase [Candidatus Hydrogenedentes bacterium]|nr:family 10 glycosylhydrolase [Candidatus Hydrogenedentota bacterium]
MIRAIALVAALLMPWAALVAEPFIGAYVHLHRVAAPGDPVEKREADIRHSVATAKRAGITVLMPYVYDSAGRAYYPSAHHPEHLYGEWDAAGAFIAEARKAGIRVYPTVPVLVSGHDEPRGILAQHPEWAIRHEDGGPYGYISAANPAAREWIVGMLRELVTRYQLDGVTLDYLRYPNRPILLDEAGMAAYNEATSGAPYTVTDRGDTPWQRFKESQLTELAKAIDAGLPGVRKVLYSWGAHVSDGHYVGQRWADWVKAGYIDVVNASGYCYTDNYGERYLDEFRGRMQAARALMPDVQAARLTFTLGVVTSHGAIKKTSDINDYLTIAREEGIEGVAFFTLNTLEEHVDEVVDGKFLDATAEATDLNVPDAEIQTAYEAAATQNVLAAVNPDIFPGYWSVCADGIGHGLGNTYPALDGHQMADALLFLGQVETVRLNWDYVTSFQRVDGQLPFAILPASAGKAIGPPGAQAVVDPNGGLYEHWVPDNPLRALGYPTYIQNADVLYRMTGDRAWLEANLPSVNRAADYFATMITPEGAVGGAGYYVERPTRVEYDGVTQGHAVDAFRRLAALNQIAGNDDAAQRYAALADKIEAHFQQEFWAGDHFAEYIHPERGKIVGHGLTDTDWAAIATGVATNAQRATLWPQLRHEMKFRYSGMPTGIATRPETYESWEFSHDDRMDLAAMGRVWYIECWARARMGDGAGLVEAILPVCETGKASGYYWRERYNAEGGFGVEKYCEYPANLIRIVQRFVMGVDYRLDGSLALAPCVPDSWWDAGFGQTLRWRGRELSYRFRKGGISGTYAGNDTLELRVRPTNRWAGTDVRAIASGAPLDAVTEDGAIVVRLNPTDAGETTKFEINWP